MLPHEYANHFRNGNPEVSQDPETGILRATLRMSGEISWRELTIETWRNDPLFFDEWKRAQDPEREFEAIIRGTPTGINVVNGMLSMVEKIQIKNATKEQLKHEYAKYLNEIR
jgi:hypothetical protein